MKRSQTISIVDDDESVRDSLHGLLRTFGFRVAAFESAESFLDSRASLESDCLVLDVGLGGMSGPELQQELASRNASFPIIFITARGSDTLREKLIADGAVACLLKPLNEEDLVAAVKMAVGDHENTDRS